jgi:hypothetical protein
VQQYTLDVREDVLDMSLKFTGTSGQVKNLKVIQPGNADGEVWSGKYVEFLKQLGPDTIRVMDMANINENTAVSWADRPMATDVTFIEHGIPWEDLVDLANKVDANLWVPVPARANDDYVRQLGALLKANLEPELDVYVEYANETWSTLHEPGKFNLAQAKAEVAANPNSNLKYDGTNDSNKWQYRRNARRLKEIVELWDEVWTTGFNGTAPQADPTNTRVKAILGGRASEDVWFTDMLKYVDENYGAPSNYFYGGAGAWYFSMNKFRDELINGRTLSTDEVFEGLEISVGLYESERRFESTADRLGEYGLKLAAYELGVDTMGGLNTSAKAGAHRDLRMMPLMDRFVRAFEDQGGVVANWYTLGARQFNTPDGAWGLTDGLANVLSPKAREFRVLRGVPDPERPAGEIDVVLPNGVALVDGSSTVTFGDAPANPAGRDVTFEVRNDDFWPLTLTLGAAPAGFEIVEGIAANLIPGTSDTFTLRMLGTAGNPSGTIEITTNDPDENPFTIALSGGVGATGPAEVTVLDGGTAVASGAAINVGTRGAAGPAVTRSLTIRNDGGDPLQLGTVTAPAGYTVSGVPASLASGASATLTITLAATEVGTYAGTLSIPSNDADENPFTLNLTGAVSSTTPPPAPGDVLVVTALTPRNLPATAVTGQKAKQGILGFTIRNDTGAAFAGPVTLTVHASGDAVLDGGDAQVATLTKTLKLGVGATGKPVNVKVRVSDLPAGQQVLLATATANQLQSTMAGPTVDVQAARVSIAGPSTPVQVVKPLTLGKRATLAVPLQNTGNVATTKTPATYTLQFTTDGTEAGEVFETTASGKLSLKPNAGLKPQKVSLTLPATGTLPAGSYTVLVRLNAELNDTNGDVVARLLVTVA